jgi:D-arginine dehydrogenase
MTDSFDVAIIGAGLIGASASYHLAEHCKVVLLEQEAQPGYHSSGRSAAILLPPYGGPVARALTAASVDFLLNPPPGFSHFPITSARGCLIVESQVDGTGTGLDRWLTDAGASAGRPELLTAAEAVAQVPILRAERIRTALALRGVRDIDAAGLLQGFLKAARAHGAMVYPNAPVHSMEHDGTGWTVRTPSQVFRARTLINAAGAWAGQIAERAGARDLSLVPTRRTLILIQPPDQLDVRDWPVVVDAAEQFYFKAEGARLAVSPADCTPVPPGDIQPDEWDIAIAVQRFEEATNLRVPRVERRWAGLRTFAPDDEPIIGFDLQAPNFLWAAAFGGFGVQTSPAAGRCCASLILHEQLPDDVLSRGVTADELSPRRLSHRSSGQ